MIFSISDLQSDVEAENFDGAEGEEGEAEVPQSYPVRCSVSITKVSLHGSKCHVLVLTIWHD